MATTHAPTRSTRSPRATAAPLSSPATGTRRLLLAGALSAPLWTVVALGQAATREGFDITRHPLSALSNGSLGWLQITLFVVVGLLAAIGSVGVRRALRGTPGGVWAPRLLFAHGIGLIAAGALVMDPVAGFPAGTPEDLTVSPSWQSIGHMAAGSLTFCTLIAANYVLVRHFRRTGDGHRAVASAVAGTALLLGNGWAMGGGAAGTLALAVGAITAMLWVSAVTVRLARRG
ncbi:DUF998 domain-containing protein [Streptomyces sp. NPDC127068]|uniref:DUF998 domain-containing protein n=1 Tax=Streptomyces sp. NPDC127068 TaxID=3347127 RepID=UPI003651D79A